VGNLVVCLRVAVLLFVVGNLLIVFCFRVVVLLLLFVGGTLFVCGLLLLRCCCSLWATCLFVCGLSCCLSVGNLFVCLWSSTNCTIIVAKVVQLQMYTWSW